MKVAACVFELDWANAPAPAACMGAATNSSSSAEEGFIADERCCRGQAMQAYVILDKCISFLQQARSSSIGKAAAALAAACVVIRPMAAAHPHVLCRLHRMQQMKRIRDDAAIRV